jgi:hypothetical protein
MKKLFIGLTVLSTLSIATNATANPATTLFVPSGYGADSGSAYVTADIQSNTRGTNKADGEIGVGIGLGDASNGVGIDANYTVNSLSGSGGGTTGDGGFSLKLHRRLSDDTSVAIGYNQFAKIGTSDYPNNSVYGSVTKVFATKEKLSDSFSRVAVTVGYGSGVFNNRPFGAVAVRVAKPISLIAEYTGQDIAAGVSFAVSDNLTLTAGARDIDRGARFVAGASYGFKF